MFPQTTPFHAVVLLRLKMAGLAKMSGYINTVPHLTVSSPMLVSCLIINNKKFWLNIFLFNI